MQVRGLSDLSMVETLDEFQSTALGKGSIAKLSYTSHYNLLLNHVSDMIDLILPPHPRGETYTNLRDIIMRTLYLNHISHLRDSLVLTMIMTLILLQNTTFKSTGLIIIGDPINTFLLDQVLHYHCQVFKSHQAMHLDPP